MRLRLLRFAHLRNATLSHLVGPGLKLAALELPWRDNRSQVSCIPPGEYAMTYYLSPRRGGVYLLHDVPERSMIEIHIGNYTSDTLGCIVTGLTHEGTLYDARTVDSTTAFRRLRDLLGTTGRHSLSVEIYNPYSE